MSAAWFSNLQNSDPCVRVLFCVSDLRDAGTSDWVFVICIENLYKQTPVQSFFL